MRHLLVFLVGIYFLQISKGQVYQLETALPDSQSAPCEVSDIWYQPGNDLIIVSQGEQYIFNGKDFRGLGPSTIDREQEKGPNPVPIGVTGLNQEEITSWIHSADQGVWIGTRTGNLFKFQVQTEGWKMVLENRVSAGAVEALAEDRFGNCWIATKEDGLLVARPVFKESSSGEMPNEKSDSPIKNVPFWKLWVDEITVDGESIDASSSPSLDPSANETKIELDGEFFAIGAEAVYQYRIRGTQDSWWSTDQQTRSIILPRLAPGEFLIEVRTLGTENQWSPPHTVINFAVPYPLYYQAWFLPTMAIVMAIVLFIFYNYRVNKAREREFYLEKLIRERTRKIRNQKSIIKNMSRKLELTQEDSEGHCIALLEAIPDLIFVSDRTGKLIGSGFNQENTLFTSLENAPHVAMDYFPTTVQPLCEKALAEAVFQTATFEFTVLLGERLHHYDVRVCSMENQAKRLFLIREINRRSIQEKILSETITANLSSIRQ